MYRVTLSAFSVSVMTIFLIDHSTFFDIFFFFNHTATTEIYTLSLHDALPIAPACPSCPAPDRVTGAGLLAADGRSEEHTSELQSRENLVCRLLLEKKK